MDGVVFVSVLYLCLLVRLGGWVEVTKLVKIYVSLQSFPQFSGEEFCVASGRGVLVRSGGKFLFTC